MESEAQPRTAIGVQFEDEARPSLFFIQVNEKVIASGSFGEQPDSFPLSSSLNVST